MAEWIGPWLSIRNNPLLHILTFTQSIACLAAFFGLLSSLEAAPISWEVASDTTSPLDVLNEGELLEAFNGTNGNGVVTVNGVDFEASSSVLPNGAANGMLNGADTLDSGLNDLLNNLSFGGGTSTTIEVGNGNLVVGQNYTIQLFLTDLRGSNTRTIILGDDLGSEVTVDSRGAQGSFGQNALGSFVADGPSQTLSLEVGTGFGNCHLTAYQIRSLDPVPVIESLTASPTLISGGDVSTLTWTVTGADSVSLDQGIGSVASPSGSEVVEPNNTTTYTLTASNMGGSVSQEVTVGVDEVLLDPELTEFLASNATVLADEDGEFSDWIEISNRNGFTIDLGGYFLSDDLTDLTKWAFPAGTMLAGESSLVVFASEKDRSGSEFHTNFRLSASGEDLALVAPDGVTVISSFPSYGEQFTDISFGIGDDGVGFLSPPSPGAANGGASVGFVADTAFDVDRGFFDSPFTVTISSETEDATIVYTVDGTEPTLDNGVAVPAASATAPGLATVTISETTVLRAAAFKEGLLATNVDTQTYLFVADILQQPEMDPDVVTSPLYAPEMDEAMKSIRTLSIVTDPDNLFDNSIGILENTQGRGINWERPVSIEFFKDGVPDDSFQADAGLRVFGNGSRGGAKNSLRLLFKGQYGPTKLEYPLFGEEWVTTFNTVVLRAQGANSWGSGREEDRRSTTYLQDAYARDLQTAMGHPTTGATFVHLFLNGEYWGLYNPVERPDGAFGEEHFGGDETDYDSMNRRFSVEVVSGTKDYWDEMISYTENLLDTQAEYEGLAQYVDIENLIDYFMIYQFLQSRDGPDDFGHNNMRLMRSNNPSEPFQPYVWDMEYSMIDTFGTRNYGYTYPIYNSARSTNRDITDSIAAVYIRLLENNAEFQLRYADQAYRNLFNGGVMSPSKASELFENRATFIEQAILGESARWGDHRRADEPYTRDVEWNAERNRLNNEFFPARQGHMVEQLRIHGLYPDLDPPAYSQHGGALGPSGVLTLEVPSNVSQVYFLSGPADTNPDDLVNSLDPRLTGGLINSQATLIEFDAQGGTGSETELIVTGDTWSYLDDGSDLGTAWQASAFDDSSWSSGPSPLGYGENGLATTVSFGSDAGNKFITTYFRKDFNVADPAAFEDLTLSFQRDDGIAIYLNGVEVSRDNLNAGAASSDIANAGIGGPAETAYLTDTIDASLLQVGGNTIAVEIHQRSEGSSDIRLDLRLTGNPLGSSGTNSVEIEFFEAGWLLARSYDESTGEWSALNEAFFTLDTVPADASNLIVSKIHYNPAELAGTERAVAVDPDEFEFIELMNVGSETIDLADVTIWSGITFTFGIANQLAPGERILVVENQAAFEARYASILGEITFASDPLGSSQYGGRLSNEGDELIITDALGGSSGVLLMMILALAHRARWGWLFSCPAQAGNSYPRSRSRDELGGECRTRRIPGLGRRGWIRW